MSSDLIVLTLIELTNTLNKIGYSDEEIAAIITEIHYHFSENQPRFMKSFVG